VDRRKFFEDDVNAFNTRINPNYDIGRFQIGKAVWSVAASSGRGRPLHKLGQAFSEGCEE
jgi:hypothetical protein